MSGLYESLRHIFSVLDNFLNITLRNEKLSKTAEKERSKVSALIKKLYSDYQDLNPNPSLSKRKFFFKESKRDSVLSAGSSFSYPDPDVDESPNELAPTTVKALTNHFKIGFLQMKSMGSKQKPYCVLHNNTLYWFSKPSDKQQEGAISVKDYEFKTDEKKIAKKNFTFALVGPGKKPFQFVAATREDLESWKEAFDKAHEYKEEISEYVNEDDDGLVDGFLNSTLKNENLRKTDEKEREKIVKPLEKFYSEYKYFSPSSVHEGSSSSSNDVTKGIYATLDDVTAEVKEILNQPNPKPLPDLPQEKINVPDVENEMIYDAESKKRNAAPQLPFRNIQLPTIPTATSSIDETYHWDDVIDERFDDIMPMTNTASSMSHTNDQISSIPTSPPPLPPREKVKDDVAPPPLPSRFQPPEKPVKELPPLPKRKRLLTLANANLTGDDYENMYCGKWKCKGLTKNELSFDQGDIIHIINRELDAENWWIGELKGQIGLVPKPFLCQAYELVA